MGQVLDAFKKPSDMSLQVYKAKVMGMVSRYSSATLSDVTSHAAELYNRFVGGLEGDWREYIEESIPFGKETIDNAYNQALKFEEKGKKKNQNSSDITGAAMTNSEKNALESIRHDLQKLKLEFQADKEEREQRKAQGKSPWE